jgi:polyhydroxyalkanoate synthesis regulator phasin
VPVAEENIMHDPTARFAATFSISLMWMLIKKGLISKAEAKTFVEGLIKTLSKMPEEIEQMKLAMEVLANIDQIQEIPTNSTPDRN